VVAASSRLFAPSPEGLDAATQIRHLLLLLAVGTVIGLELLLALIWQGARPWVRGTTRTLAIAAIVGIGVVIVIAAIFNHDFWRQAILSPIQRALLATGYFTFFAAALLMWTGSTRVLKPSWRNIILAIMGICALLICAYDLYRMESINRLIPIPTGLDDLVAALTPIWGTTCIVVGVLLTTAALLPRHVKMLRAISPSRHHAVLATIIILAAVLAQWLATLYNRQPFRERAWVQSDPWANARDFFANQLQVDTSNFLALFLVPALNLLPLLGLAGLIGMLSAAARSNPEELCETDDLWIERVLKFLFAAFVIGYGGAVLGLRTPIAFLIGLLVLPFAWNPRADTLSDSGDHDPDDADHDGNDEATELGLPRPPALQGLATSGWWSGGALATRLGSGIAIAPVTFFVILFLVSAESAAWSSTSPFAMAAFLSAIAYELAFWLVAAFVFGCLFPYLRGENGIIKAIALAAVYIGANAAAALIGVSGDALWRVRSFQLLLFLILLGVLLDQKRLPADQQTWQGLAAHYDLHHAAAWAKHVLPLVSALAAVAIQLLNRNSEAAITNLISGQANDEILAIACKLASESGKVC
jgi:hypothetical protein